MSKQIVKVLIGLSLLMSLLGCAAIKQLDLSSADNRMIYKKAQTLPPLEIPPQLNKQTP